MTAVPRLLRISLTLSLLLAVCAPLSAIAEAPARPSVTVLIYHEIVADAREPGETVIPLRKFEAQMQWLADHGYQTLSMAELVDVLNGKRPAPERSVVLTFDDGWRNVLQAVPVLNRHNFKASFWIITGKGIGGEYLDWSDIEKLAQNPRFEIGSHTVTHPWDPKDNLVTWSQGKVPGSGLSDVRLELSESKQTLEEHLGRKVRYLAWPCGWYTEELIRLAQEAGYEALLTAEAGPNYEGSDPLKIKRVFVDGACSLNDFEDSVRHAAYHVCQKRGRATLGHLPPEN